MLQDNITFPLVSRITVHPSNNAMTGIHCHLRQITQPLFMGLMDIITLWSGPAFQKFFLVFYISPASYNQA